MLKQPPHKLIAKEDYDRSSIGISTIEWLKKIDEYKFYTRTTTAQETYECACSNVVVTSD